MPCYHYVCDSCGYDDLVFRNVRAVTDRYTCPTCNALMRRDYKKELAGPPREFSQPIEMHSLALNSREEIADFARRNPEVEISADPDDPLFGVPLARNRHQKLAILKNEGWEERN